MKRPASNRGPDLWDAIVVGAGPGGSTAAALLAERGHRVLVLEREAFPRFHIGESLLPACMPVLERLGVEPADDTYVYKRGAEFVCEASGRAQRFAFDDALPGCPPNAWHVDRARFDTRLRDRARSQGADVRHGVSVNDVAFERDHVRVTADAGAFRARYLIDASGQGRLLAHRARTVEPYRRFGKAAVFTHFERVGDAAWDELGPGMDIRILLLEEGWGWIIPLPGRRLSVGVVTQRKITDDELDRTVLAGPLMRRWAAGARRLATHTVGNFSYRNGAPFGARFGAIGDAACFLDPVFSSGVTLAMRGAESVADALGPALDADGEAAPDLLAAHDASMNRAYRTFAGLIDRFYNARIAESIFLADARGMKLRAGVLTVLAGDVWRDDNPFQDLLLRARRPLRQTPA